MSGRDYDAIVIGARCAGSPTAMLLARAGHRVLLLDRAAFPSDTMSTHLIHPPGVAALRRWSLLDQLRESGCPRIDRYSFDFGPFTIAGSPQPIDGVTDAYCPRRTVLDRILVDAAVAAGAELRERFEVEELRTADGVVTGIRGHMKGGPPVTERARFVVGADGRHSLVARTVQPEQYNERPSRAALYYAYWSGLDIDSFDSVIRGGQRRGWAAAPTHDGLTVMPFGWPLDEFAANRRDIERSFFASIAAAPEFEQRVRAARRESRFVGSGDLPGYFREPYGPGWALVGDAGYHKNPITAMGINDAFRDAELVADAIHDDIAGVRPYGQGMRHYQRVRDREVGPIYDFTDLFAQLEPPPPEVQQLLAATARNQEAMDAFVSVQASTLPAPAFFDPDNVARIMRQDARA
jgi:2-polyprenyl-6-methoxyphenol hydroxylase-like FAD-dependent oxidoreductase